VSVGGGQALGDLRREKPQALYLVA
jgi:hypothetical protein